MGSILPPSNPQFLVIGAGSRGSAYARAVNKATSGTIAAVAELDSFKRAEFGQKYIWQDTAPTSGQAFADWREYIGWEIERRARGEGDTAQKNEPNITGVFICTLDQTHAEIIRALAPLNLHILCEKPLALNREDCLSIYHSLSSHQPKIFSIGHVLRYSPHNMLLRRILCHDKVIGEIVSIEHTEPIGYWHFSHSYVRGNWRRSSRDKETDNDIGSLLTKSCHDIDFIMWLLCSPSPLTGDSPHLPATVMSHGALTHFRRARKPVKAGKATNCLNCDAEPDCVYSAKKIYRDKFLRKEKDTGWPVKIVVPEIEDIVRTSGWEKGEERLMEALSEDYNVDTLRDNEIAGRSWYGRCVYESDNNVVDDQSVVFTWEEDTSASDTIGRGPKQAVFHMTYPTQAQCDRRGRIYGSLGEITYDSKSISVFTFADGETQVLEIPKQDPEVEKSHGGGDWGLAGAFVKAVQAVEDDTMSVAEAQREFVGCDLQECIRSHAAVFAAEEARRERTVIDWNTWWASRMEPKNL